MPAGPASSESGSIGRPKGLATAICTRAPPATVAEATSPRLLRRAVTPNDANTSRGRYTSRPSQATCFPGTALPATSSRTQCSPATCPEAGANIFASSDAITTAVTGRFLILNCSARFICASALSRPRRGCGCVNASGQCFKRVSRGASSGDFLPARHRLC